VSAVREELLRLERGFWEAAGDRSRYEARLAPDAVHVFPGWGVAEREAVLSGVDGAEPWRDVRLDDPRVVELDESAAALVYTAVATRGGQSPYRAAITSVYRRSGGDWQLVLHQQTPLD
jgi:hypothetical protein